ncbi:MAG: SidJ-related pseudokinase [Thermodesulfobacteriota bacterium]
MEALKHILFEEQTLHSRHAEFPARFIAACNLRQLARANPRSMGLASISNLEKLMHDPHVLRHRQAFFLFREAAQTMTTIAMNNCPIVSEHTLATLRRLLRSTTGHAHRAATEAVGSLPVTLSRNQQPGADKQTAFPAVSFRQIAAQCGEVTLARAVFHGRSLTLPCHAGKRILVIKLARRDDAPDNLAAETWWMKTLRNYFSSLPVRFNVPEPLEIDGFTLFRLHDLPLAPPADQCCHPETIAIAYTAHQQYFAYANEPVHYQQSAELREVMVRNSWLFGHLAGQGIIHTAPIPLFHNRVQSERREDNGLYDWPLAGRLDQWLASCRHPNFGLSGLRDFEHFQAWAISGEKLYWHLGAHILSLLLVAASYFRNRDKALRGLTAAGQPVDARFLFEETHLMELINDTLASYYQGFVGCDLPAGMPFDLGKLVSRMIEEMGVDRHMTEMLRLVDQRRMSDREFRRFLSGKGFSASQAAATPKGEQDIALHTGPHLGGFNESISIPELIAATASMAATCVLGRYVSENASHKPIQ